MGKNLRLRVGIVIRSLREHAGLKQEDLAKASNLSRSYIGMIETERKAGSLGKLEQISKALGFPLSRIIKIAETERDEAIANAEKLIEKLSA